MYWQKCWLLISHGPSSCRSVILAYPFSSSLSCFVRCHNLLRSLFEVRSFLHPSTSSGFISCLNELSIGLLSCCIVLNKWCDMSKVSCCCQFIVFVVQVCIPVWFVVFSRTFWDTFLCCLKNIIAKLFYKQYSYICRRLECC